MKSQLKRQADGTIEITLTIPWKSIQEKYDSIYERVASQVEVPGFRKGKAPKDLTDKHIKREGVYEEVLKKILPQAYADVVKDHQLKPIINPQINLAQAKEGEDWIVNIQTCEKPQLKLGDYKQLTGQLKSSNQKKVWVPGDDQDKNDKKEAAQVDKLLDLLYQQVEAKIPGILIEQEVNRRLSRLYEDLQKLGLSLDQYLANQGKSAKELRDEYAKQVKKTLTLEFALEEIANKENINVQDQEIAAFIKKAKSDEERKALQEQQYYVASILKRKKTLDFLTRQKPRIITP